MRRVYVALLAMLCGMPFSIGFVRAEIPRGKVLEFEAFRNGSSIGTHRLNFKSEGDRVTVDVSIRFKVDLAFVTLYRYEHNSQEIWEKGSLIGLATRTNDDGKRTEVRASAMSDQLQITGSGGAFDLPFGSFPTTYWNRAITGQTLLLDSQDGVRTTVAVAPPVRETFPVLGKQSPADRFSLSGELNIDLWYSPKGEWVGLKFNSKGSEIVYARRTPLDE